MDSSMIMSTATTTSAASMSTMAMSGMDSVDSSNSSSMMGMDSMAMVFFTAYTTPLYSYSWMPGSIGQYAGTCIFLIVFGAIFRVLLFLRGRLAAGINSSYRQIGGRSKHIFGNEAKYWRAIPAVKIATLDTIIAGVGYLLMLAVMTMNVGYFMSVLAGVFVGSMMFGQFMNETALCA